MAECYLKVVLKSISFDKLFSTLIFLTVLILPETVKAEMEFENTNFLNCQVIAISDGDTVVVSDRAGKQVRVQLAFIDAPDFNKKIDKEQPFYSESRNALKNMILNKDVIIESQGYDNFGSLVGIIFLDNVNVNLEMVLRGLAEIYYPIRISPEKYNRYYIDRLFLAEDIAKNNHYGIWSDSGYISPYVFRRKSN